MGAVHGTYHARKSWVLVLGQCGREQASRPGLAGVGPTCRELGLLLGCGLGFGPMVIGLGPRPKIKNKHKIK